MPSKNDIPGEYFLVLMDGEFAGYFSIPVGNAETEVMRAALSSNPTIVNFTELQIDINDLPNIADGWFWNGTGFEQRGA